MYLPILVLDIIWDKVLYMETKTEWYLIDIDFKKLRTRTQNALIRF